MIEIWAVFCLFVSCYELNQRAFLFVPIPFLVWVWSIVETASCSLKSILLNFIRGIQLDIFPRLSFSWMWLCDYVLTNGIWAAFHCATLGSESPPCSFLFPLAETQIWWQSNFSFAENDRVPDNGTWKEPSTRMTMRIKVIPLIKIINFEIDVREKETSLHLSHFIASILLLVSLSWQPVFT